MYSARRHVFPCGKRAYETRRLMPEPKKEVLANGREQFDARIAECREAMRKCDALYPGQKGDTEARDTLVRQIEKGVYESYDGSRIKVYTVTEHRSHPDPDRKYLIQVRSMDTQELSEMPMCGPDGFLEPVPIRGEWKPRYTFVPEKR